MAKFDVYRQKSGGPCVLDCQADLLSDLNTRLVVPLLPIDRAPKPAARLNPIFEVEGVRFVMVTQFAASVPIREIGEIVQSLGSEADAIGAALDMLIIGF
ncbi:plasmid maintenance protein CcdB [Sphingobium indicum IP26]|uniref:Toxin CcdB n=1 Tax=Sphingobium indicum F2 TaxID=1450518 RepID=A0A8E1C4F9_9SPHN|nr:MULTISPECIES: CcdB family protein [Sphingobium]EPR16158.1 plasmid maintenance protein CcdB [Sphingobium indicum IP26]EQB01982.1 plasmid maintenance protein CcdB [Sphingobium sp. HDIP04]KER37898.1 plasmid maintenance protein CcdB [Sphingobium indicum F2]